MSDMIVFTVPGTPVGKGRPKFARRCKFVTTYTPEKTVNYENLVKIAASQSMGTRPPIDGAVDVELSLFVIPPASWSNKKRTQALAGGIRPTSKPDIDNVLKGIADACNGIVWLDDKQIVDCRISKRYAERTEAVVLVKVAA